MGVAEIRAELRRVEIECMSASFQAVAYQREDSYYDAYRNMRDVLFDIRDAVISGGDVMALIERGFEIRPAHWPKEDAE